MTKYKPKLSAKFILPLLFTVVSCGNIADFKSTSTDYSSAKIAPNGLAYFENGISIPYRNLGVEVVVSNIPKTKTQSNSSSTPSTSSSMKFYTLFLQPCGLPRFLHYNPCQLKIITLKYSSVIKKISC